MRRYCKIQEVCLAHMVASLTAIEFGVVVDDLFGKTKGPLHLSFVRQVAMYLTHIVFEVRIAGVARAFGRDPSTVSYACQTIEDGRDDPVLDAKLLELETALQAARQLDVLQPTQWVG
ncbi:MAG TPA: chromosomal replication initiator DnaA [Hellea balneolensis]|uniref:Chromosomal replication initiator DnaA n=1 Tax=Hellea balneolensis TaxID=287478 RepID=A0A7V5NWA8_9PROT|nr:chromosomal replication initiator DnaA [Hellea balneolensis]